MKIDDLKHAASLATDLRGLSRIEVAVVRRGPKNVKIVFDLDDDEDRTLTLSQHEMLQIVRKQIDETKFALRNLGVTL